jgi:hypothetical protein
VLQINAFILVLRSEYRIMNIECRILKEGILSIFINYKAERSDSTLRHSAVRCLIQANEAGSLIIKKWCHFGVVTYERNCSIPKMPSVIIIKFYQL